MRFTFNINIMNQFAFYTNDRTNCYNVRVANASLQIDDRRDVSFQISQNDENNLNLNCDSLQIRISIKRVLQNFIATTNNQFAKKKRKRSFDSAKKFVFAKQFVFNFFEITEKKRFKNTRNRSRIDLLSRIDFNVLLYAAQNLVIVVFSSRNVERASAKIAALTKRAIKQKIEHLNQKNDVDFIKKTFEKLNNDEFVRVF